ncbi:MAG: hypothetical protein PHI97_01640 [Desulfobulbus sp.]|nr:hypothetical protein [Desulfobulbus sp.]
MNSKTKKNSPLFLGFLLLSLLVAPLRVEAAGFRLLYSNDNMGELDGCG